MCLLLFVAIFGIFSETFVSANAFPFKLHSRSKRIAGGKTSTIEEFPYLVALERDSHYHCSGTIISPKYIITAAHCFDKNKSPSSYQVRAGSPFRENYGSVHRLGYITIHEDYDEYDPYAFSDLAILKLEDPIKLDNKTKKSIKMFHFGESNVSGSFAVTAGWGREIEHGPLSHQLNSVQLLVLDRKICSFLRFKGPMEIPLGQFCAISANGSGSICSGDSGGPLVIDGKLAGVTSTSSYGCKSRPLPNMVTEVSYFHEWIIEIVFGRNKRARAGENSDVV